MSEKNPHVEFMITNRITEEPIEVHPIKIEIEETKLTEEQEQILKGIYGKAKNATQVILEDETTDTILKITHVIGEIIKILEYVKVNDKKISGSDKKAVALVIGKLLINDILKNESVKGMILSVYDTVAEQVLEVMVDVSRTLNTKIEKSTATCLGWFCAICCGLQL